MQADDGGDMGGEGVVTRDEILALPAGPDLDAEVAKARGHRVYTHNGHLREHMGYKSSRKLAPYSQLWQDAGHLLDEMLDAALLLKFDDDGLEIWSDEGYEFRVGGTGTTTNKVARAYCIWRLGVGS